MTRFGHKLNYVIDTFVKRTLDLFVYKIHFEKMKLAYETVSE